MNSNICVNCGVINEEGYTANISSGELEPDTKIFISSYERKNLNYITSFVIQLIIFKKGIYEPQEPVDEIIKIKPVKFFIAENFRENDFFDEKAMLYPVVKEFLKEKEEEKLTDEQIKRLISEKQKAKVITDNNINDKVLTVCLPP